MTDAELLTAVEAALPSLSPFDRDVFLFARLRVQAGDPLKPAQRHHLQRVLALGRRLHTPATPPQEVPHA